MPYSGPGDASLPDAVKKLSESKRAQWVALFNRRFSECTEKHGEDCEAQAFRLANGVVMANLLCFTAETAQTRREEMGGKSWLVAPVVLIKEGVLKGTGGAELVLTDEFGEDFQTWNGRPFVVGHPRGNDGLALSANDPTVIAKYSIGNVFKVRLGEDNIKGEVWIDLSRVPLVDGADRVVNRLETGEQLEVSTAYFRDRDETPGERDGKTYGAIARNLRPDHLAALLDTKGACSWADGGGAPRVNKGLELIKQDQSAMLTAVNGLVDLVRNMFKKEVKMTDIEAILKDGRLTLNEDELKELPEDVTKKLVGALAEIKPCPEGNEDPKPKGNEDPKPKGNEDPKPKDGDDPKKGEPDPIAELRETVAELTGTIEQFKTAFASIKVNEDAEKAKIVAEVVAMESAFTKDQLETMEVQTLDALRRSLAPADYSGQGGGREFQGKREVLEMPELFAKEE